MTEKWRVAPELLRSVPAVGCPLWVSFKRKLIVLARAPASSFTAVSVYTQTLVWSSQMESVFLGREQVFPSAALARHCPLPTEPGSRLPLGASHWLSLTSDSTLAGAAVDGGRNFAGINFSVILWTVRLRGGGASLSPFNLGKKR